MPGFVTDADAKQLVRDVLFKAENLVDSWDSVVTAANASAYWCIVGSFVRRGFLKAQIDLWDRGAEFQKALLLFWALDLGVVKDPENYSLKALEKWDRRKELDGNEREGIFAVALTIAGVWQDPGGTINQPAVGPMSGEGDLFGTPVDPEDPRLGETVRF